MPNFERKFCLSVAITLTVVAFAKLWSISGDSRLLVEYDPILGMRFDDLMLMAAVMELCIAAICAFRSTKSGLISVVWLSTVILCYRVGLWWIGWQKPCSCLGNLTDALHISPQLADNVMKGLLAFMFVGSVSLLFMQWRESRSRQVGGGDAVPSSSDEGVSSI